MTIKLTHYRKLLVMSKRYVEVNKATQIDCQGRNLPTCVRHLPAWKAFYYVA